MRRRRAVEARLVGRGNLARLVTSTTLAASLLLSGCSSGSGGGFGSSLFGSPRPPEGQLGHVTGFLGGVAADEPRAALIARDILSQGGNAADAAVALAFALTVTLPSRAGLGGGGGCMVFAAGAKSINGGVPEAVLFPPKNGGGGGERPAATPMLPRGMYLLHARYGHLPFESLVVPAEQIARFGTPTSRALAQDLSVVAGPLLADPGAAAVFGRGGVPLREGQPLVQPELATTLSAIRIAGVGDIYQGVLARRITEASGPAGGPISLADLRDSLPTLAPAITLPYRNDKVAFLPPPADGGLAAAAAFQVLRDNPAAYDAAQARADAVIARWRAGGGDPEALLGASLPAATLPALPASTSFITVDHDGNAVACALTMDNLFGTGRMLPGLGFLEAAAPNSVPVPELSAAIVWNDVIHAFRAAVAGSGQAAAGPAVAIATMNTLRTARALPAVVPDPGRVNIGACSNYLPGGDGSCGFAADPRGSGIAVGGTN